MIVRRSTGEPSVPPTSSSVVRDRGSRAWRRVHIPARSAARIEPATSFPRLRGICDARSLDDHADAHAGTVYAPGNRAMIDALACEGGHAPLKRGIVQAGTARGRVPNRSDPLPVAGADYPPERRGEGTRAVHLASGHRQHFSDIVPAPRIRGVLQPQRPADFYHQRSPEDIHGRGSLRDMQMLARHTNLRTTQLYIDASPEAQVRIMDLV